MQLKVIYLDDEADLCDVFKDNFSSLTVSIQTFIDPQDAVDEIKKNPPDLIFLDYRLPGTTGDKLAENLDPRIPKALITGELGFKPSSHFERVFSKPFDYEEMGSFIQSFVAGITKKVA